MQCHGAAVEKASWYEYGRVCVVPYARLRVQTNRTVHASMEPSVFELDIHSGLEYIEVYRMKVVSAQIVMQAQKQAHTQIKSQMQCDST